MSAASKWLSWSPEKRLTVPKTPDKPDKPTHPDVPCGTFVSLSGLSGCLEVARRLQTPVNERGRYNTQTYATRFKEARRRQMENERTEPPAVSRAANIRQMEPPDLRKYMSEFGDLSGLWASAFWLQEIAAGLLEIAAALNESNDHARGTQECLERLERIVTATAMGTRCELGATQVDEHGEEP